MNIQCNVAGLIKVLVLALALTLCSCGKPPAPPPPKGPATVGVYIVKAQKVSVTTELPGRTAPWQIAEVRPQVGGIILQRLFREGADVKAGQTLYQIDPAIFQTTYHSTQATLAKVEANLQSVKLKAERYAELVKINAVSQQDFDDTDAARRQAIAEVAASRAAVETARINLDYTRINAPIAGRIGISSVTPGALLTPGQALALTTVQQLDPIYVDLTQPAAELLRMKHAQELGLFKRAGQDAVKVKLLLEDNSSYALDGKLALSDVTVNQGTGTVTLRAIFPNPKHDLLPGMFVRAVLEQGVNEQALLVPQQGVTHDARGHATALILGQDNKVELRTLELGAAIGDQWVVSSGLAVGDRLIVDGLQKVKPGAMAKAASVPAPAGR